MENTKRYKIEQKSNQQKSNSQAGTYFAFVAFSQYGKIFRSHQTKMNLICDGKCVKLPQWKLLIIAVTLTAVGLIFFWCVFFVAFLNTIIVCACVKLSEIGSVDGEHRTLYFVSLIEQLIFVPKILEIWYKTETFVYLFSLIASSCEMVFQLTLEIIALFDVLQLGLLSSFFYCVFKLVFQMHFILHHSSYYLYFQW